LQAAGIEVHAHALIVQQRTASAIWPDVAPGSLP
jgi:hypothetical protein